MKKKVRTRLPFYLVPLQLERRTHFSPLFCLVSHRSQTASETLDASKLKGRYQKAFQGLKAEVVKKDDELSRLRAKIAAGGGGGGAEAGPSTMASGSSGSTEEPKKEEKSVEHQIKVCCLFRSPFLLDASTPHLAGSGFYTHRTPNPRLQLTRFPVYLPFLCRRSPLSGRETRSIANPWPLCSTTNERGSIGRTRGRRPTGSSRIRLLLRRR